MISKLMSIFSFSEEKAEQETEENQIPIHEDLKVLIFSCIGNKLSSEDKISLYLKVCMKVFNKNLKGNNEIMQNWKEFVAKFIVAKACEYRVMKELREKAKVMGFDSYLVKLKDDTNPKNSVLAIALVPSAQIDALLY